MTEPFAGRIENDRLLSRGAADMKGGVAALIVAAEHLVATSAWVQPALAYWMEVPLWQSVCPTVVCGPSGGGLHAIDEWLDLRQLRAIAGALESTLASGSLDAD